MTTCYKCGAEVDEATDVCLGCMTSQGKLYLDMPIPKSVGAIPPVTTPPLYPADPNLSLPPQDILDHAVALENWFAQNGSRSWQLLGVCSRDHAYQLERTISFLRQAIHEYDQWVEANRK